ncbi:MAG: exo-alpha-sialidase [Phycisphaerae bacterium]|nr:exo-alpha-sialidase [Phycisphaerae bacterium]
MPTYRILRNLLLVAAVLACLVSTARGADPTLRHVAVLGDSSVTGAGPTARVDAWPEQLGRLLGDEFAVRTFTRQNYSVDPKSPRFVTNFPEWAWLTEFAPEVVIVSLGGADSVTVGFPAASRLDEGMSAIISAIGSMPSAPRVIVALPGPCAPSWSRANTYRSNRLRVIDAWKRIATPQAIPLVDLEPALAGLETTLVDGVNADAVAGERIARVVATAVLGAEPERTSSIFRGAELPAVIGRVNYVDEGIVKSPVVGLERWVQEGSTLVASGPGSPLFVTLHAGEGPFRVRCRVTIEGGDGAALQVSLDDQFLLLEDGAKNLTLIGDVYRGKPIIGPSIDHWQRGEEFELEIRRSHQDLEYLIDGRRFFACPSAGRTFKTLSLIPMASTVRLRSWSVDEGMPTTDPPPALDLAARTELQVVIDRRDGQYLGHPSTVMTPDGKSMLCAYPMGHGRGAIVLRRSDDGGLTWSEPLGVPANWASSLETPTLHRLMDPTKGGGETSRLILFSGLHPARLSSSDDGGITWTDLRPVGEWGGIVTMSSVIQTRDGRALAFFHDDGRFLSPTGRGTGVSTVYSTESRDGGRSWSAPKALLSKQQVFLCEPGVTRSPDGKRLAMLLRENTRTHNSYISFSSDEGGTWSEPHEVAPWLTGDRHVIARLRDGRYFVSMRDMARTSATYGDWVAWVGPWDALERGDRGDLRVRLMDNHDGTDCGYAGVEVLEDGTVVATSYGHWTEGKEPYIVCVRIPPGELVAPTVSPPAGREGAATVSPPAPEPPAATVEPAPEPTPEQAPNQPERSAPPPESAPPSGSPSQP